MIVVADTSPINYLILLGHVDVLPYIYDEVIVPPAVFIEMQHPHAPLEVRNWITLPPPWLRQVSVEHLDKTLAVEWDMANVKPSALRWSFTQMFS